MIDPKKMLRLTPLNAQNEENTLELDPELVIGWLGFPSGTALIINGPNDHSYFSVKESVDEVKKQISEMRS